MSLVFAFGIVSIVVLLMQNARLSRKIDVMQMREKERNYEIKQLEKIILKYGKKQEKQT